MALAFANVNQILGSTGGLKLVEADVTLDTSYPTGGSAGLAAGLGFAQIIKHVIWTQCKGFELDYIPATDKLKVYQQPAAAAAGASPEVPNTTNLSGAGALRILAFGI